MAFVHLGWQLAVAHPVLQLAPTPPCPVAGRLIATALSPPPTCPSQTILKGQAKLTGAHTISYGLPGRVDVGGTATARDIIIATGSVPFVPGGIEVRGSKEGLRRRFLQQQ